MRRWPATGPDDLACAIGCLIDRTQADRKPRTEPAERLAALFVVLALTGCAQGAMGQAGAPYAPYSPGNNEIRPEHGGGDGGGGGGGM